MKDRWSIAPLPSHSSDDIASALAVEKTKAASNGALATSKAISVSTTSNGAGEEKKEEQTASDKSNTRYTIANLLNQQFHAEDISKHPLCKRKVTYRDCLYSSDSDFVIVGVKFTRANSVFSHLALYQFKNGVLINCNSRIEVAAHNWTITHIDFKGKRVGVVARSADGGDKSNELHIYEIRHAQLVLIAKNRSFFSDQPHGFRHFSRILLTPDGNHIFNFTLDSTIDFYKVIKNTIKFISMIDSYSLASKLHSHAPVMLSSGCLLYTDAQERPRVFDCYGSPGSTSLFGDHSSVRERTLVDELYLKDFIPDLLPIKQEKDQESHMVEFFIKNRIFPLGYPNALLAIVSEYLPLRSYDSRDAFIYFPRKRPLGLAVTHRIDNLLIKQRTLRIESDATIRESKSTALPSEVEHRQHLVRILLELSDDILCVVRENKPSYLECVQKNMKLCVELHLLEVERQTRAGFFDRGSFVTHYRTNPALAPDLKNDIETLCTILDDMLRVEINSNSLAPVSLNFRPSPARH